MATTQKYIKINDLEIPIHIRSYKNSKSIKLYFKGNTLEITKPKNLSTRALKQIIKKDEANIYDKYKKILSSEVSTIKQWQTGEKFYFKGEEYTIVRRTQDTTRVDLKIDGKQKQIVITVPENKKQELIKRHIEVLIKIILKSSTEEIILEKLTYWSQITGIDYNQVKIRDAITRFGSCMPSKKNLYFSSRLAILPEDKIDAIIVHELCHMKHKYHDKDFYNLVAKYIPNYKEIDKWLKENGKIIIF